MGVKPSVDAEACSNEVVVRCLACNAALFADRGWPKTFEIRCHRCGSWNVLCSSIQPRTYIPPSGQDISTRPIRKHNGCQRCSHPSPAQLLDQQNACELL